MSTSTRPLLAAGLLLALLAAALASTSAAATFPPASSESGLTETASHVIVTHFESSFLELDGIL
jgi:polyisoprenoid-binding protein YceI